MYELRLQDISTGTRKYKELIDNVISLVSCILKHP